MSAPAGADPAAALDQIAFLLERAQAPTYRVRAFRNAADVVRTTGPDEIARLAGAGRLTELRGIGATTAGVIAEVVATGRSDYLDRLVDDAGGEVAEDPAVTELLGALRGDAHSHTDWSDGGSPLEVMVAAAVDLDREWLAVTDHSPRLTVAHGLTSERLRDQLQVIEQLRPAVAPFRILTGIEVDILDDGALDGDDDLLAELDVVVASVHSKLRMESAAMTERMVAAVTNPLVDILGHCTGRMVTGRGRPPSTFDADAVFEACRAADTAVEINARPERLDPPDELLARAVDAGCLFSIDTDAHAPGQLSWAANGARKAVGAGIDPDRILTTWTADRLVEWTHRSDPPGQMRVARPSQ